MINVKTKGGKVMRKKKGYTPEEQEKLKKIIQERTGYLIQSEKLLEQIFTRSTYSAQKGGENNEVLEFIGDQVLSYFLIKKLSRYCGDWSEDGEYIFRLREHYLTTIKQELVCNETLCEIVDSWGVAKYVVAGPKDWPNGLEDQPKARADLFEAILGAIALESGWDDAILEKAVHRMLSLDKRLAILVPKHLGAI
jgi:ribonuclease-3